jgi:hypothetical protein
MTMETFAAISSHFAADLGELFSMGYLTSQKIGKRAASVATGKPLLTVI